MIAVCRVTQQDVVRRVGVNRATVSLALNEHPAVSARMRARVRSPARQHLATDLCDVWDSRNGDVGVACLALENGEGELAGIVPSSHRIGDIAAERLLRLLQRPEPVPVSLPEHVLIGGEWVPGATLRPPFAGTVLPSTSVPRPQAGSKPHSAILSLASTTPP